MARHTMDRKAYKAARYRATKERFRERELFNEFGITPQNYAALAEKQQNLCAVCKRINVANRALAVDHCHATGKIRGLLCNPCNMLLGRIETTIGEAALRYLRTARYGSPIEG
jgi:hypothetical protein